MIDMLLGIYAIGALAWFIAFAIGWIAGLAIPSGDGGYERLIARHLLATPIWPLMAIRFVVRQARKIWQTATDLS